MSTTNISITADPTTSKSAGTNPQHDEHDDPGAGGDPAAEAGGRSVFNSPSVFGGPSVFGSGEPNTEGRDARSEESDAGYSHRDFLQLALTYRRWGWSVFPLGKGPRAKKPVVPWKAFQDRRPGDRHLGRMFTRDRGVGGLAVVLGPISGPRRDGAGWPYPGRQGWLYARDFDTIDGYKAWAGPRLALAESLPTARTARGVHVYARAPVGHPKFYRTFGDGELLGDGKHYVVLPPSEHPTGFRYRWANREPFAPSDIPVVAPGEAGFFGAIVTPDTQAKFPVTDDVYYSGADSGEASGADLCVPGEVSELAVVRRCVPAGTGERNARLFDLARGLKALPHLADADAGALFGLVERWYELAEPVIGTKSFAACWADFRRQWPAVRVPAAHGFEVAVGAALAGPIPESVAGYADLPTRKLVAVCAVLHRHAGAGVFYLACRTAARVCGFGSHMTAARRLTALAECGVLELVEKGTAGVGGKASRYRLGPTARAG